MKKNHNSKNYDPANQCVACGAEMPEGDHVCKLCRDSTVYHHALNLRITTEQLALSVMDAIDRACIQKGLRIGEVVRGALDAWMKGQVAHQEDVLQEDDLQEDELQADARDWLNPHRIDVTPGFDSGRGI